MSTFKDTHTHLETFQLYRELPIQYKGKTHTDKGNMLVARFPGRFAEKRLYYINNSRGITFDQVKRRHEDTFCK